MKKIVVVLMFAVILGILSGCVQSYTEKTELEEFKVLLDDFAKENDINMLSSQFDSFRDITPEHVFAETGCQIFKSGESCESYLLYEGELYSLGMGFGGWGIVDIETADFNKDGEKELLYTYSWGSGIHRSCFGYFDLAGRCKGEINLKAAEVMGFIQEELMLKKISDDHFEVYKADIEIEGNDFTKTSLIEGMILGEIIVVRDKPTFILK